MCKKFVLFVIFVLTFSVVSFSQNKIDFSLEKCFAERIHDRNNNEINGLNIYQQFENKLILEGKLLDGSQESYAMLMANLLNDDVQVPVMEWTAIQPSFSMLSMPSNLATSLLCYTDIDATTSVENASSLKNMIPYINEIMVDFNIGDKATNVNLVRSINSEDFDKMIYKVPLLALMHSIATYKEEMNALSSNY